MKTNLHILTIILAFGVILLNASGNFAQKTPTVGGFAAASAKDEKVIEAAEFAVAYQAENYAVDMELTSIEKAETQIVAGNNYRLCMQVTVLGDEDLTDENEEAEEITGFVSAVVYKNLKDIFSLTSWTIVENCDKKVKEK